MKKPVYSLIAAAVLGASLLPGLAQADDVLFNSLNLKFHHLAGEFPFLVKPLA